MVRSWLFLLALIAVPLHAATPPVSPVKLENVSSFTLENGLRVVVQTDRSQPIVGVTVVYHVGSRHEAAGRTGFAHLFEHLMFRGSEHHPGAFAPAFADAGAGRANAATWWDHTIFYETVPTSALAFVLYLEAERMGHFAPAITSEKIDAERGVVMNEKRLKENSPFGSVEDPILKGVFPPGHPYRWSPLGSIDDLAAATVDDARAWHARHYTPDNAVLSLAGDIDVPTARTLVSRYFGSIAPGAPRTEFMQWAPPAPTTIEQVQEDRVANPRTYWIWAGPGRTTREMSELEVLTATLGQGSASPLAKALVEDSGLASFAAFTIVPGELSSMIGLVVNLKPGADVERAKAMIDRILDDARRSPPPANLVATARTGLQSQAMRDLESVGGISGRSAEMAMGEMLAGDPHFIETRLGRLGAVTPAELPAVARRWLTKDHYKLLVIPVAATKAGPADGQAFAAPPIGAPPAPKFPAVDHLKLANGMDVAVARRPGSTITTAMLAMDAGFAADPPAQSGLAELAVQSLIAKGPDFDPDAESSRVGGSISTETLPSRSLVQVSGPSARAPEMIALLGRIAQRPVLQGKPFEAMRAGAAGRASRDATEPRAIAEQALASALFGKGHPYAVSTTGRGSAAVVGAASPDSIADFRKKHFGPAAAVLVIAGDITAPGARQAAQAAFGAWRSGSGSSDVPGVSAAIAPRVLIIDRPGAEQTMIAAGIGIDPAGAAPQAAEDLAIKILGQGDDSRLTDALRQRTGWAYWARALTTQGPGPRALFIESPVQADKTTEAISEIRKQLAAFRGAAPPTDAEIATVKQREGLRFTGTFETSDAVAQQLVRNAVFGRPDEFALAEAAAIASVEPDAVRAAASRLVRNEPVWVLVGDRAKIEKGVQALNLGPLGEARQ